MASSSSTSSAASAESESEAEIKDSKTYTEGDCSIVSSDDVRFRLPSFYMRAASSVFRDMHEIGSETTLDIPMTDGSLETAVRIRAWLDVITGKGLKINDNFPFLSQSVIQLARKYECPGVESSTIAFVHRAMEILPMEKTFQLLRVGAAIDDPEIVAKAIRVLGDVHWGEEIPPLPADQIPGVPETWMTDPSTWSWAHYKDLPLEYLWAMSRSSRMGGTKEDRGIKMMELIEEIKLSDAEKRKAERDLAMEQ